MPHRLWRFGAAIMAPTLILPLIGCGGGSTTGASGSTAVAAAPTPSPAPTPTPTPPPSPSPSPTPTPLAGPAALTLTQDFAVLGFSVTGTTDNGGNGATVQQLGRVGFRYLAAQARHELQIPGRDWGVLGAAVAFGPRPAFSRQRVTVSADAFAYDLTLFVPGDRNPELPLIYTSYGSWAASASNPSDPAKTDQNFGQFAYGLATAASEVPRSGTAQYRGFVFDVYNTPGLATVTIDFSTGAITGAITPTFNDGLGGISDLGPQPFEGRLEAGSSAVEVTFPVGSSGRTGTLAIQLTGPAADELMLRWDALIVNPSFSSLPTRYILPGVARRS